MSGGSTKLQWDANTLRWEFAGNIISGLSDLRAGGAGSSSVTVSGGSAINKGGGMRLYGENHAAQANDVELLSNGGVFMQYDATASSLDFKGNKLNKIGTLNYGSPEALTIAIGAVTVTKSYHTIATEAGAAADNLDTINGGVTGDVLILVGSANAATEVVTVRDNIGNIQLTADMVFNNPRDTLTLLYNGSNWLETARADNQ